MLVNIIFSLELYARQEIDKITTRIYRDIDATWFFCGISEQYFSKRQLFEVAKGTPRKLVE